ncbi:MAG: hypothetical protein LBN41_10210 [Enterobacteriaceae bacterium]|jgi:hypothetical protein|nr:hypothetical protein [Enterobacteriaceae bacterium]
MARYEEISNYYRSENSEGMDVERFIHLQKEEVDDYLSFLIEPKVNFSKSNVFFENISPSFFELYIWKLFFKNTYDNQLLCDAIAFCTMELFTEYGSQNSEIQYFDMDLYKQGAAILLLMACNRVDIARYCYPFLIEGLKNSKLDDVKDLKSQRLIILAVEMLASEKKQTIDWGNFGIAVDRFYSDFVKNALYSEDKEVLNEWLTALCDNHLKWSARTESTENEFGTNGYEIEAQYLLLWPFELQAVKNFRALHRLTTPEIDHPLCKTPMAIDHKPDYSKWNAPVWFAPLVDELIVLNPRIAFVKDFFK